MKAQVMPEKCLAKLCLEAYLRLVLLLNQSLYSN